jgi:membrane protein required for colicin V production
MTVFDYGVLSICGLSMLLGLWRGVVGEVIALLSWVAAFLMARAFGPLVGEELFATQIADLSMRVFAGWVTVFVAVLVLLAVARILASKLIRALGLGLLDRFAGLFFGLARALLVLLVLVAASGMTPLPKQEWWAEAKLSPPLETAVLAIRPWLPEEIAQRIQFR